MARVDSESRQAYGTGRLTVTQWREQQTRPHEARMRLLDVSLTAAVAQVYLAVDADSAGTNLAAELSRRLGRPRCKITTWPSGWQDHGVYMDLDNALSRLQQYETVRPLT